MQAAAALICHGGAFHVAVRLKGAVLRTGGWHTVSDTEMLLHSVQFVGERKDKAIQTRSRDKRLALHCVL